MSPDQDGRSWGACAAFGCPLFGSIGSEGRWYCFCHYSANPALNDAITAELHHQKTLVERVIYARQSHAPDVNLESELHNIVREIGLQQAIPTAPVTGPSHAARPYSEPA